MGYETVIYNRKTLYDQVWSRPMIHVAKDYNLSDNGLRKICKKLCIPLPKAGHWAKVQHGHKVRKLPLPQYDGPEELVVQRYMPDQLEQDEELASEFEEKISFEKTSENQIEVLNNINSFHPVVERTARSIRSARPDERGLVRPKAKKCLNIQVGPESIERSLFILDASIKALESRKIQITFDEKSNSYYLTLNDEQFNFWLEEKVKRHERSLTVEQKRKIKNDSYYWHTKEYDYELTGKLSLCLSGPCHGYQSRWSDGKKQRVENLLNKFIIGLYKAIPVIKATKARWERERIEREEQERLRWEMELQMREEERKLKTLLEEVNKWKRSQDIRAYIEASLNHFQSKDLDSDQKKTVTKWIKWAQQQADNLDPLLSKLEVSDF